MELLRAAARAGHPPPLGGYSVASNAEPCSMCASALVKAGVSAVIYGAPHEPHLDPDLGVEDVFGKARNAPHLTAGVLADEAAAQIADARRAAGDGPVD
jgi:tRNA(adenine34) deaminase